MEHASLCYTPSVDGVYTCRGVYQDACKGVYLTLGIFPTNSKGTIMTDEQKPIVDWRNDPNLSATWKFRFDF
ncbi:MAG: hypothetical protein LBR88_11010, partial [Zoogloeaceae bacterium]|nr:hypothetical protein [Zoogloeaceae bacterium]